MLQIHKAQKRRAKGHMALIGISGSGKTLTALKVATYIAGEEKGRVLVIDTEASSSEKYSDQFDFDVIALDGNYSPEQYIEALDVAAASKKYAVVIVDSLSHAWAGQGGALEMVDMAKIKSGNNNSYVAWRNVTPLHNKLVEKMIHAPFHLIVTMRAKTEYVQEKDPNSGKTIIRKLGMQPIQRDGLEYEFDVVCDVDIDHNAIVGKTRCSALDGKVFPKAGKELGSVFYGWLTEGSAPEVVPESKPVANGTPASAPGTNGKISVEQYQSFLEYVRSEQLPIAAVKHLLQSKFLVETARDLTPSQYADLADILNEWKKNGNKPHEDAKDSGRPATAK